MSDEGWITVEFDDRQITSVRRLDNAIELSLSIVDDDGTRYATVSLGEAEIEALHTLFGEEAMTTAELLELALEIDDDGEGLTDWEADFLDQMIKRGEAGEDYTPIQADKIQEIHRERV